MSDQTSPSEPSRISGPEPALGKRKCSSDGGEDADKMAVKKARPHFVLQISPASTTPPVLQTQPVTSDTAEAPIVAQESLPVLEVPIPVVERPPPQAPVAAPRSTVRFPVTTHALEIVKYRTPRQMAWRLISPEIPSYAAHLYFLSIVSGTLGRFGPAATRLDDARCKFYESLLACPDCVSGIPHRHKSSSGEPKGQRLFSGFEIIAGRAVHGAPRPSKKSKRAVEPISNAKSPLGKYSFTAGDEEEMDIDDDESTYTVSPTISSCFSSPDSEGYDCFDFDMSDVFGDLFTITSTHQPELVSTSQDTVVRPNSPFKAHASHVSHFLAEYGQRHTQAEPSPDPFTDNEGLIDDDPFSDSFSVQPKQDATANSGDAAFDWTPMDMKV